MNSKYEKMIENLKSLGSVAVAFSGGVDSTFLLKAAKEALGNNALAVTVRSCIIPVSYTHLDVYKRQVLRSCPSRYVVFVGGVTLIDDIPFTVTSKFAE